jgi:hypothetical protein
MSLRRHLPAREDPTRTACGLDDLDAANRGAAGACRECSLIIELAVTHQRCDEERSAKRHFANQLMDVVEAGRNVAALQPAAYSKTPKEARLWEKFYASLNAADVILTEGPERSA